MLPLHLNLESVLGEGWQGGLQLREVLVWIKLSSPAWLADESC